MEREQYNSQPDGQSDGPGAEPEAPKYPDRIRRTLMGHPPRTGLGPEAILRRARKSSQSAASSGPGVPAASGSPSTTSASGTRASGALTEWHEMTPGQQVTAWADLRAWVVWLTDRYELTVENRMPQCWALHPGLVEELWALRVWRSEIYGSGLRPAGQAARYWHGELDRVVHAATSRYAVGCRAGHRGATRPVVDDKETRQSWAAASPVAGVPEADLDVPPLRSVGGWISAQQMAQAIDSGEAAVLPGLNDYVLYRSAWWFPVSGGWAHAPMNPDGEPGERADEDSGEGPSGSFGGGDEP